MWLANYLARIWRSHDKVGKGQVSSSLDGMMVVLMLLGSSAKLRLHGSLDADTSVWLPKRRPCGCRALLKAGDFYLGYEGLTDRQPLPWLEPSVQGLHTSLDGRHDEVW